jgi:hypothetical protein
LGSGGTASEVKSTCGKMQGGKNTLPIKGVPIHGQFHLGGRRGLGDTGAIPSLAPGHSVPHLGRTPIGS